MSDNATCRYLFRREDSGELIEVSFIEMMAMDAMGCVTLPDGVTARRVRCASLKSVKHKPPQAATLNRRSTFGFLAKQLPEFQQHLKDSGVKGVEFVKDRDVPGYMQVEYASEKAREDYAKAKGEEDYNGRNGAGAMFPDGHFDKVRELLERSARKESA